MSVVKQATCATRTEVSLSTAIADLTVPASHILLHVAKPATSCSQSVPVETANKLLGHA